MNWIAITFTVILALGSAAIYYDLKKSFSDEHKKRLGSILGFGFVYIVLNVGYFLLISWLQNSIDLDDIKFPGRKYQFLGIVLVIVFPLLVQAKVFPLLQKRGYTYKSLRLSIDLALLLSIISLFLKDSVVDVEFGQAHAFYFTGIAVYFTFSKVLIEWLILTRDIEVEKHETKE